MRRAVTITLVICAVGLSLVLSSPRLLPDGWDVVPVVDSVLPWLGLVIPALAVVALLARSRIGLLALLLPVLVWGLIFGRFLLPRGEIGPGDLRVATFNVGTGGRVDDAMVQLAKARPDVVGLQELAPMARRQAEAALDDRYDHSYVDGTVGLWSRWPIRHAEGVDLGDGWDRALRAVVKTPQGNVTVYVVHAASVRPGMTEERDRTLRYAARIVGSDDSERLILLGDLNTSSSDPRLDALVPPLIDAHAQAGSGFGFTWPARLPITRPDQILHRGLTATQASVKRLIGSDHRAALADLRFA